MVEWWVMHWETVVAIAFGVIGLFGAYYSYMGWKRKKPSYVIRSNNIFKGLEHTVPDVEVKFPGYGPPVAALTITKIGFWNAGSETIKKQDVVKDDPLVIRGKQGVVILSVAIIEAVNPLNKVDCVTSQDRTHAKVTFDYLDKNQGAIIQVFHTGTTNADIAVEGTVMGGSRIRRHARDSPQQGTVPVWMFFILVGVLWGVWAFLATGIVTPSTEPVVVPPDPPMKVEVFGVLTLGITLLVLAAVYFLYLPKPFSKV
jgi:hypothetical protein